MSVSPDPKYKPPTILGPKEVAEELRCVRAPDLGCFRAGQCWRLGFCGFSRDETKRELMGTDDPLRAPRIKNPRVRKRVLERDRFCRCGCGQRSTDAHHVFPRSLGGDDVEANEIGLSHHCHMLFEHGGSTERREIAALIGSKLRHEEIAYVLGKREGGAEFLKRYYHLDVDPHDYQEGAA